MPGKTKNPKNPKKKVPKFSAMDARRLNQAIAPNEDDLQKALAINDLREIIYRMGVSKELLLEMMYQGLICIIKDKKCWDALLDKDVGAAISGMRAIYSYSLKYEILKQTVLVTFLTIGLHVFVGPMYNISAVMMYVGAFAVCYFQYQSICATKDEQLSHFWSILSHSFEQQFKEASAKHEADQKQLIKQVKKHIKLVVKMQEVKKPLNTNDDKKPVQKLVKKTGGVDAQANAQVNAQSKAQNEITASVNREEPSRGGGGGRVNKIKTTGPKGLQKKNNTTPQNSRRRALSLMPMKPQNTPESSPHAKSQEPDILPPITQKKSLFDLLKVMPHGKIEGKPYYHGGIDTVINSDVFIEMHKQLTEVMPVTSVKGIGSAFHGKPKIRNESDLDLYVELKQDYQIRCKDIASWLKVKLSDNGNKSIGIHVNDGYDSVRFTFSIDVTKGGVTYVCSIDITIAKKPYSPTFSFHRSCSITNNSDRLVCQLDPMPALSEPLCSMPAGGVRFVLSKDPRSEYIVTCKEWRQYFDSCNSVGHLNCDLQDNDDTLIIKSGAMFKNLFNAIKRLAGRDDKINMPSLLGCCLPTWVDYPIGRDRNKVKVLDLIEHLSCDENRSLRQAR